MHYAGLGLKPLSQYSKDAVVLVAGIPLFIIIVISYAGSMWRFLGQGSNPCRSSGCCTDNIRFLALYASRELQRTLLKYTFGLFIPWMETFQQIPTALRMKFRIRMVWVVSPNPQPHLVPPLLALPSALQHAGLSRHWKYHSIRPLSP